MYKTNVFKTVIVKYIISHKRIIFTLFVQKYQQKCLCLSINETTSWVMVPFFENILKQGTNFFFITASPKKLCKAVLTAWVSVLMEPKKSKIMTCN